jgi:hypothetical protein
LKKFNLLLLVLVFSLLLGGCSGSGNSEGSSNSGNFGDPGTSAGSQARSIKVILPSTYYLDANNQSVSLPPNKSFVIITSGYKSHQLTLQNHYTFGTTGSEDIKINIPDLKGATRLKFQIQILLDSEFDDEETWKNAPKSNRVAGQPLRNLTNDWPYFDSNITSIEFKLAKQNP